MKNTGTTIQSASLPTSLWNEVAKNLRNDYGFSRWVQDASRLMLRKIKSRNIQEFLDDLDDDQMEMLKKEIKKRG